MDIKINFRRVAMIKKGGVVCLFVLLSMAPSYGQRVIQTTREDLKSLLEEGQYTEVVERLHQLSIEGNQPEIEKIRFYLMKSDYYNAVNQVDSAGRYLKMAKQVLNPKIPDSLTAQVEFELGIWYMKMNEYNRSYHSFATARNLFDRSDQEGWYVKATGNLGIMSFLQGDTTKALDILQSILHRSIANRHSLNIAIAHQNIGRFYLKTGMPDSAWVHFSTCLETKGIPNKSEVMANAYRGLAEVFQIREQYAEAIAHYRRAEDLYEALNLPEQQMQATWGLKDLYKQTGNLQAALEYSDRYSYLLAGQYNEERARSTGITQAELRDIEKTAEIQLLKSGLELEQNRRFFSFVISGLALVILFFLFLKWKDLKKRRRLEADNYRDKLRLNQLETEKLRSELELRKKALTAESLRLIEKNDHIQLLREKIGELSRTLPAKYAGNLDSLRSQFRSLFKVESSWEEFSLYFEEIHPSVHKTLDQFKPALTLKEKRLISLIYIELSTKEIAKILGISPDSVKKGKTRLRRKLLLEENQSIRTFINEWTEKAV